MRSCLAYDFLDAVECRDILSAEETGSDAEGHGDADPGQKGNTSCRAFRLSRVGFFVGGIVAIVGLMWSASQHSKSRANRRVISSAVTHRNGVIGLVKGDSAEWIVDASAVHVRKGNSLSSPEIGIKVKGDVVIARQDGDWLALTHEPGWIKITMYTHTLIRKRIVQYFQVSNGTCADSTSFPVTDILVCKEAAIVLDYKNVVVNIHEGDEPRPQGCYVEGDRIWIAANSSTTGLDSCDRACMTNTSTVQCICSTHSYPKQDNGFIDQMEVKRLIHKANISVAVRLKHLLKADLNCTVLWSKKIDEFVQWGFGSALDVFEQFRAYVEYSGCTFVVSHALASHWQASDFSPFWRSELPDDEWLERWKSAQECAFESLIQWQPNPVKCEAPHGILSDEKRLAFLKSPSYRQSPFHGSGDLLLQTLGPMLAAYRTPYMEPYAALHIRRGDKVDEVANYSLAAAARFDGLSVPLLASIVQEQWPDLTNVFLATDDSKEIETAGLLNDTFTFRWTVAETRWPGGVPLTQSKNHTSDEGAVAAVLDDIAGLALAAVLVGGSESSFFNIARLLNQHLHAGQNRPSPWCFNAYEHRVCD